MTGRQASQDYTQHNDFCDIIHIEDYRHHCHKLIRFRLGVPVCFACFAFRNVTMADQLYGMPASRAAMAPVTGITRDMIADRTAHFSMLTSILARIVHTSNRVQRITPKKRLYPLHISVKRLNY